jgi:hypothetical protein
MKLAAIFRVSAFALFVLIVASLFSAAAASNTVAPSGLGDTTQPISIPTLTPTATHTPTSTPDVESEPMPVEDSTPTAAPQAEAELTATPPPTLTPVPDP